MATGHHYGPGPWVADLARPEWNPAYYHRADADGIGFDRTATGSDAIGAVRAAARRAARRSADDARDDLLWFHHVPWTYRTTQRPAAVGRAGRALRRRRRLRRRHAPRLGRAAPADRRRALARRPPTLLAIQEREARWWRDASLAYWMSVNGLPLPAGAAPPAHDSTGTRLRPFPMPRAIPDGARDCSGEHLA